MSDREPTEQKRRPDWAALSIVVFLLGIAVTIFLDMRRLPPPGRYDPLGSMGFGYMIAVGLVILAIGLTWDAVRRNFPAREALDFLPVIFVIGGLVLQMALVKPLGFSIATGLMFAAVAYGFGERRLHFSIPAGLVLSGLVWFIFARLLKLTLPEGPPEHWVVQALASLSGGG